MAFPRLRSSYALRSAAWAVAAATLPFIVIGSLMWGILRQGLLEAGLAQLRDALDGGWELVEEHRRLVEAGLEDREEAVASLRRLFSGPPASVGFASPDPAAATRTLREIGALGPESADLEPSGGAVLLGRRAVGALIGGGLELDDPGLVARVASSLDALPLERQYELANGPGAVTIRRELRGAALRIRSSGYVWAITGRPEGSLEPVYEAIHPTLGMRDVSLVENSRGEKVGLNISRMNGRIDSVGDGEVLRYDYVWSNPGESGPRPKVALMRYFRPWNWVICSGLYEDEFFALLEPTRAAALLGLSAAAILAAFLAYALSRIFVTRRAAILARELGKVEGGDYHLSLPSTWGDEFGTIAHAALAMAEGIRLREEELRKSQRLGTVGSLAAGVAHDLANLLGGVSGTAELLGLDLAEGRQPPAEELAAALEGIRVQARRAGEISRRLLELSKRREGLFAPIDLAEVASSAVAICRNLLGSGIELRWERPPGSFPVLGESVQLEQALINLLLNARDAILEGRSRASRRSGLVEVHLAEAAPGALEAASKGVIAPELGRRSWSLSVADDGPGVPLELASRIFEPFFTTKPEGSGLGLAVAYGAVLRHGGAIVLDSAPDVGACFRIYLPALGDEA